MSTTTAHHRHLKGQTNAAKPEADSATTNPKDGQEERFCMIQVHAYGLWEQAGKPNDDGSRVRFWQEAENAIAASCSPQD